MCVTSRAPHKTWSDQQFHLGRWSVFMIIHAWGLQTNPVALLVG